MNNNTSSNLAPETRVAAVPAEAEVRVPEAEATKLADPANLSAEATTVTPTEEQLLQEIARLWAANKVNRYELGEKLWQLKQQTKHGDWMPKVQKMGIKQRTANSLITFYREEFLKKNPPTNIDPGFDPAAGSTAEGDESEDLKDGGGGSSAGGDGGKKPYFCPKIFLEWNTQESAWKRAIDVIIAECEGVNNPTEAALFAVVATADFYTRKRNGEIEGTVDLSSPSTLLTATEPKVAGPAVKVEPALTPEEMEMMKPVPLVVADIPLTPVKVEIVDVDEEVF